MIGLKHGTIELHDHDPEWEKLAAKTIECLWSILGDVAVDIQHVGSTAITSIKAKPIVDISVAVRDFNEVMGLLPILSKKGFIYRKRENHLEESLLFACGNYSDPDGKVNHFIHVVKFDGAEFANYLVFRDYMNTHLDEAKAYESLKVRLMSENQIDPGREKYLAGKKDFIAERLTIAHLWNDFGRQFTNIKLVNKGWSSNRKYYAETSDSKQFLIRVADISRYEQKKMEFKNMQHVAALGIPMQQPVDFGLCNDGKSVFLLLTWIDGDDAEDVLPLLPETEQYVLGVRAGQILKEMQTIEVFPPSDDWFNGYGVKIDRYIENYRHCGLTFEGDERLIAYIEQNCHMMKNRTMCLTHDDYHPGNLILNKNHELFVVDFQSLKIVEPYHALTGVQFSAKSCPHFAAGQLNAYFDGHPPPEDFWRLLALYMACVAVNALPWSIPYGQNEINFAYKQISDILSWYDNMQSAVPTWYLKDFCVQIIDDVPFKLKDRPSKDEGFRKFFKPAFKLNEPRMKLLLDLKNYNSEGTVFNRSAARGIIKRDDKYLLIHSKYGDYKFPGGGIEISETREQAVIREVQEETGYRIKPESIQYFGVVHERRKGDPDDILEIDSHYYFCEAYKNAGDRQLDAYEEEYDYQVIWLPLEKAIENNQKGVDLTACPWVVRDTKVMEYLMEMEQNDQD